MGQLKKNNEVLNVKEVARLLHLDEMTVYRLAGQGEIPAKKIGRVWRFSRKIIEDWFKEGHFSRKPKREKK